MKNKEKEIRGENTTDTIIHQMRKEGEMKTITKFIELKEFFGMKGDREMVRFCITFTYNTFKNRFDKEVEEE